MDWLFDPKIVTAHLETGVAIIALVLPFLILFIYYRANRARGRQ